jgi:hypothetical protein
MTARRLALLSAVVVVATALAAPAFAQCAMCKTVLTGSHEGQLVARQLNEAILLLFFAPYVVFGSFAALVFRSRIRRGLARAAARFTR